MLEPHRLPLPDRRQQHTVAGTIGPTGVFIVASAAAGLVVSAVLTGVSLSPLTWYLARASGLTLYLFLWLAVVSGLGMTTKLLGRFVRGGQSWELHRLTTEVSLVLLALHLLSLALDPTVPLGALGVLVPFVSDVRQPWTDLGIIAGWSMVALTLSYAMRRLIGQRGWRMMHYAAFPLWAISLAHGIGAGSDTRALLVAGMYVVTASIVIYLSSYRLLRAGRRGMGAMSHPTWLLDREHMRQRTLEYRARCASLSSKTKNSSQT